ncbi:class I SAM-dependent methyltransferase [Actinoplanes sp. HUAS TT8]|uniref:class I SAM-dependent methyltransferase n=1 Tax=Actinoplanes sp. HUAS TT8 TaxID=3447453 RepID=UPI003F52480B
MDVFEEVAADYDNVGAEFFTPMGAALARAAGVKPGEAVLDVGCGRGAVLFPAAEATGPAGHVTGIDQAPSMVALTRAAAAHLPHVTVEAGDAQAPDFPPGTFDVITAGLVVFFLPDARAALAAYRRLLRPGGRLAFSTFAAHDPRHSAAMATLAAHAVNPPPRPAETGTFQNPDWLRDAVVSAGFSRTEIAPFTVRTTFRDVPHFVEWVGSHGGRVVLRRIPAERRAAAEAALAPLFPEPPVLTTTIHLIVAS